MTFEAYPLQFEPILKHNIWGGNKLQTELGKPATQDNAGESWEISTVPGSVSVAANGTYRTRTLAELLDDYPEQILGRKVFERFGSQFPLLLKFIDAKEDLSIQVHPNDELAKKRHNSFGKTEMWYIMQSDPGARLIVGFKGDSSPDNYLKHLHENTLPEILNHIEVAPGDVFFLETGTVHSIGGGILLAEIQQTSDITYRIYDFDRVDDEGKKRQLHVEQALDAISYRETRSKIEYETNPNQPSTIVDCPYFTTNIIPLQGSLEIASKIDSFRVYMCVEGTFKICTETSVSGYKRGDTVLIPASMEGYKLSGNATILEIYIS